MNKNNVDDFGICSLGNFSPGYAFKNYKLHTVQAENIFKWFLKPIAVFFFNKKIRLNKTNMPSFLFEEPTIFEHFLVWTVAY